ncbi:MAG TPA: DUF3330 domain-containing protein [Casimicrobiaceae bacterium]|nr:DUF3330 domain-containing protein [Casimicrobiaceae bacterium]
MPPSSCSRPTVVCVCEQEVPISEALIPEAVDYVVYFCGLDCYDRWVSSGLHRA